LENLISGDFGYKILDKGTTSTTLLLDDVDSTQSRQLLLKASVVADRRHQLLSQELVECLT